MKRLSLLCLLFLLASATPARALLILVSAPASVSVGDAVNVVVSLDGFGDNGLAAYDLTLQFDESVLQYQSVSYAPTLGLPDADALADELLSGGNLNVALVSLLASASLLNLGDSVELFTAHFTATSPGTSFLRFAAGATFGDVNGDEIPGPVGGDGSVVTVVPEPSSALLLGLGCALLARGRSRRCER